MDQLLAEFLDAFRVYLVNNDPPMTKLCQPYVDQFPLLLSGTQKRLLIDVDHMREKMALTPQRFLDFLSRPLIYGDQIETIIQEVVNESRDLTTSTGPVEPVHVEVGWEGHFGSHHVTPRFLTSNFIGHMVCLEGIAIKASLVRPKVVQTTHYCEIEDKFITREYRDSTSAKGIPTTAAYPTQDEQGHRLVTEFGLSVYEDHQLITVQEPPERAPPGQLPHSIDVILSKDLVDRVKPGDRVQVMGIYKALGQSGSGTSGIFNGPRSLLPGASYDGVPALARPGPVAGRRTVVLGSHIKHRGYADEIRFTDRDSDNIHAISQLPDAVEVLSRSVAPSIFGHEHIKLAVLLMLLGGVEKRLKSGLHLRGDINLLLVGDPSTAKSQLLRFVRHIAPLAVMTTGRGSSGVGLTAAVTQDTETGDRRLEAGAMVLADKGVVCIDEFDKMSELDRVAIHEVMEQQTVTINKAGIHASLNARCSVIAAANPAYGQYDDSRDVQANIALPDSLLSRFDLTFIVLDRLDEEHDRHIAEHVLRLATYRNTALGDPSLAGPPTRPHAHPCASTLADDLDDGTVAGGRDDQKQRAPNPQTDGDVWEDNDPLLRSRRKKVLATGFLKKYVALARELRPELTDEANAVIEKEFTELRGLPSDHRHTPITPRTLETLIRLSTAHARARLSETIEEEDALAAVDLIRFTLNDSADTVYKARPKRPAPARPAPADGGREAPADREQQQEPADQEEQDDRTARRTVGTKRPASPGAEQGTRRARQEVGGSGRQMRSHQRPDPVVPENPEDPFAFTTEAPRQPAEGASQPGAPNPRAPAASNSPLALALSPEQYQSFRQAAFRELSEARSQSLTVPELLGHLNKGPSPLTEAEAMSALQLMSTEGSLSLEDDIRAPRRNMSLKLWTYPNGTRAAKALICAKYYNIPVEIPAGFEMGVTNKTPEFLAKNPMGKVPVLETPQGCVFESHAIARFFARGRPAGSNVFLYGRNDVEAAQIDQWLDFIQTEVDSHIGQWLGQIFGYAQFNPKFLQEAKKNLGSILQVPERHLLTRTFMVGERLTLADICLACELKGIFETVYDEAARRSIPNLTRWFLTCVNQPEFHAVLGEVKLCVEPKEPAKPESKKPEKAPKEEKPAAKPKEEKPKPKKEEAAEEEEEEHEEKKKVNPLDLLPPSPFNLEWWKRRYANAKEADMPAVLAEFWAKLEEDGYKGHCLYFSDHKYIAEYKMQMRVNNLLGGFIQRLDELRKHGFGCMTIYGEAPNYAVQGLWVFRGTEIPFAMTDCPDYDTLEFTRCDPANPEHRQRVEDVLCCRGTYKAKRLLMSDLCPFLSSQLCGWSGTYPCRKRLMKTPILLFFVTLALSADLEQTVSQTVAKFFDLMDDCDRWVPLFSGENLFIQDPFGATPVTSLPVLDKMCREPQPFAQKTLKLLQAPFVSQLGAATLWEFSGLTATGCEVKFRGSDVFTTAHDGVLIERMIGYFNQTDVAVQMARCLPALAQ
ncbi:putative DNA replication licensing factor Mcm3 [Paratrimastix pyriformis]|uniref:DNA helicase n=1 Tax=Paratrimastix pyriformis TaxID=342808 RepID=A0ABQ8ULA4_9EUKA|nr:putative DNA replication licensing factor Mcm3 [Paratrimastix pyriformis]